MADGRGTTLHLPRRLGTMDFRGRQLDRNRRTGTGTALAVVPVVRVVATGQAAAIITIPAVTLVPQRAMATRA